MSSVQIQVIALAEDRIRAVHRGDWVHVYIGTVMLSTLTAQAEELHTVLGKALLDSPAAPTVAEAGS